MSIANRYNKGARFNFEIPESFEFTTLKELYEKNGKDNTDIFQKGADETLRLVMLLKADMAILKQNSPSCGSSMIYDGTFSGKKIPGSGITAALLIKSGIRVISEDEIVELS